MLVSAAPRQRAGSRFLFRAVDRISPKGFAGALEICELVDATICNGPLAVAESEWRAFLKKCPDDQIAR
jgi:adenylate cyclase